ncbi:MAG TPA: undecaprenyldiphospho-muramoylpentapeptide beta-N-acetylglucosaminyltransferase [Acidimicrobiales bacterium]|nr:undecaprenyldiphospho-muramoylpentapeptide beta-N-acetylglucosaminyltransferase [Acidimicrobiales bacterium]
MNANAQPPAEGEVIVTGGGTAGHVLPAIAVGRALVAGGRDRSSICYVGAANGLEAKLAPEAGFRSVLLPGRGIQRRLTADNLGAAAGLLRATARAFRLVAGRRPAVVVTVGGYAGVPCSLAALALGIPVVVVNVDAVPGAANRLVGRFARASAVALPGTALPRAVLTGAPVRPEVLEVERSPDGRARARRVLGIEEGRLLVAVTGGSLGARRLNEAALGLARLLAERRDLTVYHVTGERDHEMVLAARARLSSRGSAGLDYRVVAYEQQMPEVLAASDVVICRAGASTVAELTVIGTPSILVPLPGAPADHQRRNAEVLAAAGAGLLVPDPEATSDRLATELESLLADRGRLERMERSALALGRRDAAVRVAVLVEEIARRPGARGRVGRVLSRRARRSAPPDEGRGPGAQGADAAPDGAGGAAPDGAGGAAP